MDLLTFLGILTLLGLVYLLSSLAERRRSAPRLQRSGPGRGALHVSKPHGRKPQGGKAHSGKSPDGTHHNVHTFRGARHQEETAEMPVRGGARDYKIVVWRCPGCGRLSRLHAMCDWCTTLRPEDADMRVVMHSIYMKQFEA